MKKKTKEKEGMEARGERLKKLRQDKGLSLKEIHQKTKIHMRILEDLENDALGDMAIAYIKGILKIYCSCLGADFNDFLDQYAKKEQKTASPSPNIEPSPTLAKPHLNVSLAKRGVRIKPLIFFICLLLLAASAFKFGKNISAYKSMRLKQVVLSTPVEIKAQVIPSVKPASSKLKLGIRAKEDCWLEVKSDGKTIFRNVLKKGAFELWEANKEIEFSLGNAAGVDVEVSEKLLPPLGRRGQVIKNIKLTKDGLVVPE